MDKYIPFINRTECCKILLEDILYIEQQKREIIIVTEDVTYRKYCKINEMDQYLDGRFFYSLKTLVINFSNVMSMRDQTIRFKNGVEIYLGRHNYVRTKQSFAIYIKNPCNSNGFIV